MKAYSLLSLSILTAILAIKIAVGEQTFSCSEPRVLFCDDFEGELNPLWVPYGECAWTISDGLVSCSASGSDKLCMLSVLDSSWRNYVFAFDIRGNAGVDKSVVFRESEDSGYNFSIRSDWITGDEAVLHTPTQIYAQILQFPSQNGVWYHVEIYCVGNRIRVLVDGTQVIDYIDPANSCPYGGIGLANWTGSAGSCDVSVDNVKVTMLPSTRGDADGDGLISVSDAVFVISYIFAHGPGPNPVTEADSNCDGKINISDAVHLINYIFAGGPAPCEG